MVRSLADRTFQPRFSYLLCCTDPVVADVGPGSDPRAVVITHKGTLPLEVEFHSEAWYAIGTVEARDLNGGNTSRRAAAYGRAELLANSGRRGMGRLPRKCKLRGPCRYPVGTLRGPRTFRRGLIGKIRQNSGKFWPKYSEKLAKFGEKFGKNSKKNSATFEQNFEH